MYDSIRNQALTLLKVPREPHPPLGDPSSLRVFRAGRNYYRLSMAGWAIAQLFALAGILFWTGMLLEVEHLARAQQAAGSEPSNTVASSARSDDTVITPSAKPTSDPQFGRWKARFIRNVNAAAKGSGTAGLTNNRSPIAKAWAASKQVCVEVALVMPSWVFPIAWVLKIIGIVIYLIQLVVSYVARRLDYEMRWYLVTDRSLRLRHGVWVVWESTMSFANVQQVAISQDPLQRLLGLANVKVQSAGGGTRELEHQRDDMHVGYFHSVTNAEEIRDLILERLRRFRESGLGDPDEKPAVTPTAAALPASTPLLAAARELASEARALRAAVDAA